MRRVGFIDIRHKSLMGGIATIIVGKKS